MPVRFSGHDKRGPNANADVNAIIIVAICATVARRR